MLKETHYPSKWSVAAVFLLIVMMIVGVFAWAFYFNLGTFKILSDQSFDITVNGNTTRCEDMICEISLPPGQYAVQLSSDGYYDLQFDVLLKRFETLEKQVSFLLIPFLQEYSNSSIPEEEEMDFFFTTTANGDQLVSRSTEEVVTVFETLNNPVLSIGDGLLSIVDEGRLFFVDIDQGRKQRRFGNDVLVERSLTSHNAERSLLFVETDQGKNVWLWFHETNELSPLNIVVSSELLEWQLNSSHMIYLITDQVLESGNDSFLNDLLDVASVTEKRMSLYSYNLDTSESQLIHFFDGEEPKKLLKRKDRFFIEYADARYSELVVNESSE